MTHNWAILLNLFASFTQFVAILFMIKALKNQRAVSRNWAEAFRILTARIQKLESTLLPPEEKTDV